VRPLAFIEIGHGVQANPIDPEVEPEVERFENGLVNLRVVEVEVRLMRVEAMPVVGVGHRVPGPIGGLEILEYDPGFPVPVRGLTPDVEVARPARSLCAPGALEPWVLIGSMVD